MSKKLNFHENLGARPAPTGSSDRSFGIVFAVFFAVIGCWPLLFGNAPRVWALVPAGIFLALALLRPGLLAPLNALWTRLGLLLHRVVNPIVLGLIFFVVMTPAGLLRRWLHPDPLRLAFDREAATYWIEREPGPPPESMTRQF